MCGIFIPGTSTWWISPKVIVKPYTNCWEAFIWEYQTDATKTIVRQAKIAIGFSIHCTSQHLYTCITLFYCHSVLTACVATTWTWLWHTKYSMRICLDLSLNNNNKLYTSNKPFRVIFILHSLFYYFKITQWLSCNLSNFYEDSRVKVVFKNKTLITFPFRLFNLVIYCWSSQGYPD